MVAFWIGVAVMKLDFRRADFVKIERDILSNGVLEAGGGGGEERSDEERVRVRTSSKND